MKLYVATTLFLATGATAFAFTPKQHTAFKAAIKSFPTSTSLSFSPRGSRVVGGGCPNGCCGSAFCTFDQCVKSKPVRFESHASGCNCGNCGGSTSTSLRMVTSEEVEVPEAVAAADDADATTENAHNVDRPKGANAAKAKNSKSKKAPISELTAGQELTGKVKKVTPYGAFVDIGYQSEGLLHISEIADDFVTKLRSILVVNQEVNVRVIAVNTKKKQVALTMRSIKAEERRGSVTGKRHAKQAAAANALADSGFDDTKMVVGEVVSTLDFGAFVRFSAVNIVEGLKGELVGLVFNSHLAKGGVKDAKSVVVVGQKVQVRVRSVDKSSGKVSLSMIPKKGEPKQRGKREKK